MQKLTRIEPVVFYTMLALLLVPVWVVDFFVTSDGPCHLYNSKILLDWWENINIDFYHPFYHLNKLLNPNWLFNLITIPLLDIFGPEWAERIFFSIYVLLFGLGFRFLIGEINPNAKFISSLGLLFCYNRLLMAGFLNNALSFVIWFWIAALWWRNRNVFSMGWLLLNSFLFLLLYSAHPMGLIYCIMMIGSMMTGLLFFEAPDEPWNKRLNLFYKRFLSALLSSLPSLVLFAGFIIYHNWSPVGETSRITDTLKNIGELVSLVTVYSTEKVLALATSITCLMVFGVAILLRIRQHQMVPADGLILFILFVLFSILNPVNNLTGGLEVSMRMSMIPFFAILCWASTAPFPLWSQLVVQLSALVILICFLTVRIPVLRNASDYAEEIYSCDPYIKDTATLLVLNYDWAGQTPDGKTISDRAWLFLHVDCYLGINRSAVISDNYEVNYSYFPLMTRWETNMYLQTDKEGINFDHRPPRADILSYHRRTKEHINYVLLISYRDEFKDHPYTQEIFAQLEQGYDKIFTSQHKRAILYQRKI